MRIDFGLMAIVLIQLGAVIGCLLAWFRIRTEIDRIKDRLVTETVLNASLENRINPIILRLTELEGGLVQCEQVASQSSKQAVDAVRASKEIADFERRLVSLSASMSAFKRYNKPVLQTEIVEEIEEPPPVQTLPQNLPPPLLRGRDMNTFGKSS